MKNTHNKNIIVKRGDYGPHVIQIQKGLRKAGFWPVHVLYNKNFGPTTDRWVRKFQAHSGVVVDGKVGFTTMGLLGVHIDSPSTSRFDETYKDVMIHGSHFPDPKKPVRYNVRVRLNPEIKNEYIPEMLEVMKGQPRGFQLLMTIMAYKEGFRRHPRMTRSYRTKNPGNIGNTDSGANKHNGTLESGVLMQKHYFESIINGTHRAYPMNKRVTLKPYYSPEIAKHSKLYGMSPYLPGYTFTFTGQLDQFVKIYATGPRAGNGYLSMICTYFKKNGINITPESKIQDIIKIK